MTKEQLLEKLRLIENLYAGAATPGERNAAASAFDRIKQRLEETKKNDPPMEYRFSMGDVWSRKLFVALLRRYDIRPYRYPRQKRTTVMAKAPQKFIKETLWPEFQELSKTLQKYLSDITDKIIAEGVFSDNSEAEVINDAPAALPK